MKFHNPTPSALPPTRRRAAPDHTYAWDLSREPVRPDPYPDLGREIVATHRALVREAAAVMGTDVGAISEAVCLPRWNVGRALFALGLAGKPSPNPKFDRRGKPKASRRVLAVAAWLTGRKPATTAEIADAFRFECLASANSLLRRHPDRFRCRGFRRSGTARVNLWEAV